MDEIGKRQEFDTTITTERLRSIARDAKVSKPTLLSKILGWWHSTGCAPLLDLAIVSSGLTPTFQVDVWAGCQLVLNFYQQSLPIIVKQVVVNVVGKTLKPGFEADVLFTAVPWVKKQADGISSIKFEWKKDTLKNYRNLQQLKAHGTAINLYKSILQLLLKSPVH